MSEMPPSHQPAEPECQEGVSRSASEAESLLRQLIANHSGPLYRYAYRLTGQGADAEDLTQQTFLLAQQKLHQLRETERAAAWLFAIVRSCFLKACRKRQAIAPQAEWDIDTIASDSAEIDHVDQELLAKSLAELPEEFRVVVLMFYFEDLSYKEIAEQLELPIGTVMSRLSRAKGHLRKRLAGETPVPDTSQRSPLSDRNAENQPNRMSRSSS